MPIVFDMIENYKKDCLNNKYFSDDSFYYHVSVGVEGFNISASDKEYYYDLTPPPPAPPSMPDVIEQLMKEDLEGEYSFSNEIEANKSAVRDTNSLESFQAECNESLETYKYNVYQVKSYGKNIILYSRTLADIDSLEQIVNPLELIDITEYAQKFRANQAGWDDVFVRMACEYQVDSVVNIVLKKTYYAD